MLKYLLPFFFSLTFLPAIFAQQPADLMGRFNLANSQGETAKAAQYLADIADFYHSKKNIDSTFKYFNDALAYLKGKSEDRTVGNISYMAGIVALRYSDNKNALRYFEMAIEAKQRTGERRALSDLYLQAGLCCRELGQSAKGMKLLEQAVDLAKTLENKIVLTDGYRNLAEMAEEAGLKDKAIEYTRLLYESEKVENNATMAHVIEEKDKSLKALQKRTNESEKQYKERIEKLKEASGTFYEATQRLELEREILHEEVDSLTRVKNEQEFKIARQLENMQVQGRLINAHERAIFYQRIVIGIAIVALLAIGLLSVGIYRNYMMRTRANRLLALKNTEIELQRNELQMTTLQLGKAYENIQSSINYAKRIQYAMLPNVSHIKSFVPEAFVLFKPREAVSGDFYWFATKGNKALLAVADCTGHGVPGAFMSMIGYELLNEIVVNRGVTQPSEILLLLDRGIRKALRQEENQNHDGMDIALCTIDFEASELQFAGAKNPLAYIRNGQMHVIKGDKTPIGGHAHGKPHRFTHHVVPITEDATSFYLYSDGYQDQFGGPDGRKVLSQHFRKLLLDTHQFSMDKQGLDLNNYFEQWKGLESQVDDVLVLGFRI